MKILSASDKIVSSDSSRRAFLKNSSLAAAGVAALSEFPFVLTSRAAADDPIRVALVGAGGRGGGAAGNVMEAGTVINSSAPNVKLVAIADLFPEQMERARTNFPEVPESNCFVGFDAYQKVLAIPEVNYVILATPPGFRPMQARAAVEAGKNVFMEKPVATDGPGVRSIIETAEMATKKGLSIVGGTQRRHQARYIETIKRLQEGAIGDIIAMRAYWNGNAIWHRGYDPSKSEMENQIRNWYHYVWLSGDHIVEQHMHNIDVCNWVMNDHPIRAYGLGGRQALGDKTGHIWDHFAVEFEYSNGARMYSQCRQISGTDGRVAEAVDGTKGTSNPSTGYRVTGGQRWSSTAPGINPYVQEHVDLIKAIRSGQPLNEGKRVAESTLTAIMGRESAYCGQTIEWDDVLNSTTSLTPKKIEFGDAPKWEVAMPGKHKLV